MKSTARLVTNMLSLLHDVERRLDRAFDGRDGLRSWICETGDEYGIVRSGGWVEEGEPARLYATPHEAVDAWMGHLRLLGYEDGEEKVTGTLYWRTRPTLTEWQGQWDVYSRFVISSHDEDPVFVSERINAAEAHA